MLLRSGLSIAAEVRVYLRQIVIETGLMTGNKISNPSSRIDPTRLDLRYLLHRRNHDRMPRDQPARAAEG